MSRIEMNAVFGLILIAILTRLLPHPPNFAPITSIALFSGIHFSNKRIALLIPLGIHLLMPVIYLSFILISVFSFYLDKLSLTSVLAASSFFFLISNLGVWYFFYPLTWVGFTSCFVAAIPFFATALAGDLFYSAALQFSFKKVNQISLSL
jgi:hypothetical protein